MSEETTIQRLSTEGADMLTLAGVNDENLVELARQTGTKIALRGETLAISGNAESVARAMPIAQRMIDTAKQQLPMTADDVLRMSIEGPRVATETAWTTRRALFFPVSGRSFRRRRADRPSI